MSVHKVLVFADGDLSDMSKFIVERFNAYIEVELEGIPKALSTTVYKAIVFDGFHSEKLDLKHLQRVIEADKSFNIPVLVLANASSVQDKLDALEIGADDFIEPSVVPEEACARVTKAMLHRIAADQLSNHVEIAKQTALTAMEDNSDLGANIQFLLSVHDCDNLDQLGQMFFSTIERYGLKCSLQLRGDYEIKNMEAHGMAKDLESQLLTQLKDRERYIDFGPRTIINFGRVSLLIKNMPVDEADKYGSIKDNTFALIQGMNARVQSLDDEAHLIKERETLRTLASDVRSVMRGIQASYQAVMLDIANEVDHTNESILAKLPSCALTEADEAIIETIMSKCVANTTEIFNKGLHVDEAIKRLDGTIDRSLHAINVAETTELSSLATPTATPKTTASVELF